MMKIHDTLCGIRKDIIISDMIRIYLCGVTVYDESHIGHARTIVVFDVLRRFLEHSGGIVQMIQNFTDIDDKIIRRADAENVTAEEISRRYISKYFEDFDKLNVKRATAYPKATEHIEDIIQFILDLIEKKHAYTARNGVYFSVSKFTEYGKLSKKNIEQLQSGARVEIDESKVDPLDFALWKFADSGPAWNSPWGRGRPGWHIECSTMCAKYLGGHIEIHGGGRDLIFPHHENEIAQSESHDDVPLAKVWMHVGMVTINGEKMSKSIGNIRLLRHVLNDWGPNVTRLFCLSGHYSKPIDYSEDLLRESLTRWRQAEVCFYEASQASQNATSNIIPDIRNCAQNFDSALENDFNTHLALSAFFLLAKEVNQAAAKGDLDMDDARAARDEFERMSEILGLRFSKLDDMQESQIDMLVSERARLREKKCFEDADKIRQRLDMMGIEIIDHGKNTTWVKREKIKSDGNDLSD